MNVLKAFLRDEAGQDGVEYALLIGFVSCAIVLGAAVFTTAFNTFWGDAGTALTNAGNKATSIT